MCEIFYSTYYLSTYFVHGTVIGALEYTMMQTVRETIMKTNNKRKEPGKECRQSRVPLRGSPKCTYWGSMQILLGALHMSIPTLKSLRGKLSEHSHLVHLSRYLLHKVLCQGGAVGTETLPHGAGQAQCPRAARPFPCHAKALLR